MEWLDSVDEMAAVAWDRDVATLSPDTWPLFWSVSTSSVIDQTDPQRTYVVWTADGRYWTFVPGDEARWMPDDEDCGPELSEWSASVIRRYREMTSGSPRW